MTSETQKPVQALRNSSPGVKPRRHPLIFVVGILAFLMFGCGGYLVQRLLDPSAFPIRKIAVEGEFNHLTSDHVQRLVSNAVHGGFFDVDVTDVRAHILDEPWIRGAAVRRVWPDTIRVSIREQDAVARWGEYALLNGIADIFVPGSSPAPKGLAVLDGPIGTERELLARYFAIQKRLDRVGLRVARIKLSERRALVIDIEDGATLVVGRHALAERLRRFNRAFDNILKDKWERVALVDLRYTNGFAIREKTTAADNHG